MKLAHPTMERPQPKRNANEARIGKREGEDRMTIFFHMFSMELSYEWPNEEWCYGCACIGPLSDQNTAKAMWKYFFIDGKNLIIL